MPVETSKSLQYFIDHFASNEKIKVYEPHHEKIHSVGWNSTGSRVASGSLDRTITVHSFDGSRLTREHVLKGHQQQVDQLCWHNSDPDLLVSAGGDKTMRIWDARSRKQVVQVATKGENINVTWSPDGQTIAVGNKDDLIQFIDVRTNKIFASEQFKDETNEISWNNSGSHFFLTNGSGQIVVKAWPSMKTQVTLQAHPGAASIICIKFDPSARYFAVGAADALVTIWDASHLACLRSVQRLEWPIRAVSFSGDGRLLASGSEDLLIDVALTDTGEKVTSIKCDHPSFSVSWHPKEYVLAFACDDKGKIQVFGFPSSSTGD